MKFKIDVDDSLLSKLLIKMDKDCDKALRRYTVRLSENIITQAKKNTTVGVYNSYLDRYGNIIKNGRVGGNLRRSWTRTKISGKDGNYKTTVYNMVDEYASFYEYGHRQNVGQFVPMIGKKAEKGNYVTGAVLKKPFVKGRFP